MSESNENTLYVEFIDKPLSKATAEQLDIIYRFVSSYLND